jgi:hypothetical protein
MITEYNFIINPEIEKICEQKAKEEYEIAKQIEARWPKKKIDVEYMVQQVKEEIHHKNLILKPKDVSMSDFVKPDSEVKSAWFNTITKYAEEAVQKVMSD